MAWTEITRRHYRRDGLRYESDTTDAEWFAMEPLLPADIVRLLPHVWFVLNSDIATPHAITASAVETWRRVISRFAQLRPIRRLPKTTAIAANSTAIALALHGEHTPEFRGHHTNTDAPPNEQAGTAISEQPLVVRVIGSLLDK